MVAEHDSPATETAPALEAPRGPAPRWRAPWAARLALALIGLVVGLGAGTGVVALAPQLARDWLAVFQRPTALAGVTADDVSFAIAAVSATLIGALVAYRLARAWLVLRGWRRYLAGLERELGSRLAERGTLTALGYVPLATGSLAGTPGNSAAEPLAHQLAALPRAVVVGDDGAGKSTAVLRQAHEQARSARPWRTFTGRQIAPIVISLPRYLQSTPDRSGLRLAVLVGEFNRFGATMLAGQVAALARHGQIHLYLDGLDEVTPDQARQTLRELSHALRQEYRSLRLTLTCHSATLDAYLVDDLPLLRHLPLVTLLPVGADEVSQIIQRAAARGQLGQDSPDTVLAAIDRQALLPACGVPATLAMLLDLLAAGKPLPATRTQILSDAEALRFAQANVTGAQLDRARVALGFLALALRVTRLAEITGARAWDERDAVRALLADTTTATATMGGNTRPLVLDADQLTSAIEHAHRAGILERGRDGQGLRFRHALWLNLAAARHLDAQDAGLGRLSPLVLRPEWLEVVVLWGGLTADPAGLAERLTRFATTPGGVAAAAGLGDLNRAKPLALALALTIGVLRFVPQVIAAGEDPAARERLEIAQQNLRDLFDRVLRFGVDDQGERRDWLTIALRSCESATAGELTPALARLIRAPHVNRLMRAQAVQVLGWLASPPSLATLTRLLLEPDPIVREALNRGFSLAGAEAVPSLLDLLAANPTSDAIRRRAVEALTAIGSVAAPLTLDRLARAPQPTARAAAATALGALRDRRALDPLLLALNDDDLTVRLAATRALGRLGDAKAQSDLLRLAQAPGLEQRLAAIEALGLLRGDRAIKPLLKWLEDPNPKLRAAAAEALGHIGDARAVAPLRAHLGDKDPWAQAAATTALRALGQRA